MPRVLPPNSSGVVVVRRYDDKEKWLKRWPLHHRQPEAYDAQSSTPSPTSGSEQKANLSIYHIATIKMLQYQGVVNTYHVVVPPAAAAWLREAYIFRSVRTYYSTWRTIATAPVLYKVRRRLGTSSYLSCQQLSQVSLCSRTPGRWMG